MTTFTQDQVNNFIADRLAHAKAVHQHHVEALTARHDRERRALQAEIDRLKQSAEGERHD